MPIVSELNSFQDHPQLHGRLSSNVHERLSNDLHGRHSFQDHEESTKFLKKTFHTIYTSKSVSSISNEMDPDSKTKILTILNIKLPHRKGIDNLQVKVDDGAEANILPLRFFQDHVSSCTRWEWLPQSRIHGKIQDQPWMLWWWEADKPWLHQAKTSALLEKSFQDHIFMS